MTTRETAMRLSFALDMSEADVYALLTSTGVAPIEEYE